MSDENVCQNLEDGWTCIDSMLLARTSLLRRQGADFQLAEAHGRHLCPVCRAKATADGLLDEP